MAVCAITVSKGPVYGALEDRYSGTAEERQDLLSKLRSGTPWDADVSTYQDQDPTGFASHLEQHWFGVIGEGADKSQPPRSTDNPTTGWWTDWFGNAGEIIRQALIRALELSMGLAPGSDDQPTRLWPVQFFWVQGVERLEATVSWRTFSAENLGLDTALSEQLAGKLGEVTLVLATPRSSSFDYPDLAEVESSADLNVSDPAGLLVIGHPAAERDGDVVVGANAPGDAPNDAADLDVLVIRPTTDAGGCGTD
jgi:hypothetical protein